MNNLSSAFNFGISPAILTHGQHFDWPEYLVFGGMLAVSAVIGLYYGCMEKKSTTTAEFLMGGKNLGVFPVASSLIASFISAITLLGQPSEVYTYGTLFWMSFIAHIFVTLTAAFVYLPVFYDLQLTSVYEYLELRFSRSVRLFVSATFILKMTSYMAIVVYGPSLALSQVTGMSVYGCVVAIFAVCTFYTTVGGLKAVVWTDTLQLMVMFASTFLVMWKGVKDVGGPQEVWRIAEEGGRIEFLNFDLDPRTRHTVFGLLIGNFFVWLMVYGCNQAQIQRYLSLPSMRKAQWALLLNLVGMLAILTLCCYAGLVVYAKYSTCDPLISKKITKPDQLFPLFVMETVGEFPGLPGLFVAGVFSGTLSTISTGLNSLAAIGLEDFVKSIVSRPLTESESMKISKSLAIFFSLVSFALVFLAEQLGQILIASLSINGIMGGPILGIFTLGILFPWANKTGAFTGAVVGLSLTIWICVGAFIAKAQKLIVSPKLPVSVTGCDFGNFTGPSPITHQAEVEPSVFLPLYQISYIWYAPISTTLTIVIGLLVSFITGPEDLRRMNKRLISPAMDKGVRGVLSDKVLRSIGWHEMGEDFKSK